MAANEAKYTKEQAEHFYETMCTIRKFEETIKHDFLAGEIPGFVHLYIGEEAIATGVCSALRKDDMIESTHRGHGHCVAKGADVKRMMAEIYGKKEGLCQGRGGSMHIADFSVGMLGANGVVGGGYNLATGAALANKMILKNDKVSVVFFGDGASNRGTFHEAMNVASAWKLPVIFVNEMNCWASTTPYRTTCNVENISDRAAGYHVPGVIVDGQDVFAVYEAAKEAVARAHAAGERGVSPKQAGRGTLPDAAQRPRRGADLPRQWAKEKVVTAKTAPRDIRGVTQGQRQLRTAANETMRSVSPYNHERKQYP